MQARVKAGARDASPGSRDSERCVRARVNPQNLQANVRRLAAAKLVITGPKKRTSNEKQWKKNTAVIAQVVSVRWISSLLHVENTSLRAMASATTPTTTKDVTSTAATVVRRVWAVLFRRITVSSASALTPIPNPKGNRRDAVKKSTRAMATVTTKTTMRVVTSTEATVALRVWAVLCRRTTVRSASALIPIPNPKGNRRDAVKKNTRAMATVTTTTTLRVVTGTAVTVALRVWAVL